jgi:hypothetical protein
MVSTGGVVAPASHGVRGARGSCSRSGMLMDRDGTIIVSHGCPGSIGRGEFIEGPREAIAEFNRVGIPVPVLRNQAGVALSLCRAGCAQAESDRWWESER